MRTKRLCTIGILILLLSSLVFAGGGERERERRGHETSGGDNVIHRFNIAKALAISILEKDADSKVLTMRQRNLLANELRNSPSSFSNVRLHSKNEKGEWIEVSANTYQSPLSEIRINLRKVTEDGVSIAEAVALWIHEAGHHVGLCTSMALTKTDNFENDIGFRLVMEESVELESPINMWSQRELFFNTKGRVEDKFLTVLRNRFRDARAVDFSDLRLRRYWDCRIRKVENQEVDFMTRWKFFNFNIERQEEDALVFSNRGKMTTFFAASINFKNADNSNFVEFKLSSSMKFASTSKKKEEGSITVRVDAEGNLIYEWTKKVVKGEGNGIRPIDPREKGTEVIEYGFCPAKDKEEDRENEYMKRYRRLKNRTMYL